MTWTFMTWTFMTWTFMTWAAHRAVPFGPWATLAGTLMTRTAIRSTFFLTGHSKPCVEEHLGARAIRLGDVRFVDALTTGIVLGALNRGAGVLRRDRGLYLGGGIASERLFGGMVHVSVTGSAGTVWRLSVLVGVLALLRLCRGSRSSGVVNS